MFSIAVVGAAHIHLHDAVAVIQRREDVSVDLVFDEDRYRSDRWATAFGATAATRMPDLSNFDGIMIYAQPSRRKAPLRAAGKSGLPVFIEKPFALDAYQAGEQLGYLSNGLQVGHFIRYWAALMELAERLRDGDVGAVLDLRATFTHQGTAAGWFDTEFSWMKEPREGGGGFFDLAVHCIDAVLATGETISSCDRLTLADEHHGTAQLGLTSGAVATIEAGWSADEMTIRFEAFGTDGTLVAEGPSLTLDGVEVHRGSSPTAESAIEAWLDAVTLKRPIALVSAGDVLGVVRTIDALRSLE